ncbi:MAG: hypothetical protein ACQEU4_05535 [Bacillota bacterium]
MNGSRDVQVDALVGSANTNSKFQYLSKEIIKMTQQDKNAIRPFHVNFPEEETI